MSQERYGYHFTKALTQHLKLMHI